MFFWVAKAGQVLTAFGDHLKGLILGSGYSSVENFALSHESLSKASLYKIVSGKQEARLLTIVAIANVLEIPPSRLLDFPRNSRTKASASASRF
jgi:predicted transcriptional regulator